jgi:hypothetical protein
MELHDVRADPYFSMVLFRGLALGSTQSAETLDPI